MKKKPLVNKIFLENRSSIENYMKKEKLSYKGAITNLTNILNNLDKNISLEEGKEVNEYLPVKLGYYKPLGNALVPTEKGRTTYKEYIRFNPKSKTSSII